MRDTKVLEPSQKEKLMTCPHCGGDTRLQAWIFGDRVWIQCPCGYGWDVRKS